MTNKTSKPPFGADRKIAVQAKYIAMLAPFISTEEERRYLRGIYITPYKAALDSAPKGVIMVATDGHRMGIIYDGTGAANGGFICAIPKCVELACGEEGRSIMDGAGLCHFTGSTVAVTSKAFGADIFPNDDPAILGERHIAYEHAPAINGKYPDFKGVLPPEGIRRTGKIGIAAYNPAYLGDFGSIAKYGGWSGGSIMVTHPDRKGSAAYVFETSVPEFVGVLMPMQAKQPKLPDWFKTLLPKQDEEPAKKEKAGRKNDEK